MKIQKGFTLIELLIALGICCILITISVTSYTSYIRKSRRTDAINSLLSISLAQERYRSNNETYGTFTQVWENTTSEGGYYNLSMSNVSSTSYTISATATGDQVKDAVQGINCTPMVFSYTNGTITKSPAVCWPP